MLKKLLKRRFIAVPLVIIMTLAVCSGIVYAATTLSYPSSVRVVSSSSSIIIYSDSTYIRQLQNIEWNDLPVGGETVTTVYIKNVGNTDAIVTASISNAPAGIWLDPGSSSIEITAGETAEMNLKLEASASASSALSSSFTIGFTSVPKYLNP